MNEDWKIYQAPEDEIPDEDKLRLEAYLRGRQDEHREKMILEMKREMRELEND